MSAPTNTNDWLTAPTLSNEWVTLEALSQTHADDLSAHVGDLSQIWYADHIPTPEGVPAYIERLLAEDGRVAWAIVSPAGAAIGVTTYLRIDPSSRNLEVGSTWISKDAQGSSINPAIKLLLLQRAFEDLGCLRVEIRTHHMNFQSRRAVEKLGAKLDGVLRRHKILKNGQVRDTCVYSILDYEWAAVKTGLEARLAS